MGRVRQTGAKRRHSNALSAPATQSASQDDARTSCAYLQKNIQKQTEWAEQRTKKLVKPHGGFSQCEKRP